MSAVVDTVTGAQARAYTIVGPASYSVGGFIVDASADFSWLGFLDPTVTVRGALMPVDYEIALNVDLTGAEAAGKGVVKLVRPRYDKPTLGAPTGQPGGVTVAAALTAAATTTGSGHTHAIDHNHPSANSAAMTAAGAAAVSAAGTDLVGHIHALDLPNLTGTSSSTTHAHNRAFEYDHTHGTTQAATALATAEVAAATDLSTVTFVIVVYGFGKG